MAAATGTGDRTQASAASPSDITLAGRYRIFADSRVPEFDSPGAVAFAAVDMDAQAAPMFALVCDGQAPVRLREMAMLRRQDHEGSLSLKEWGIVPWGADGVERVAVVFNHPPGARITVGKDGNLPKIPEDQMVSRVIQPALPILSFLGTRGSAHRAIRPANMYHGDAATAPFVFGECVICPPGLHQPVVFETIERSMADPAARGHREALAQPVPDELLRSLSANPGEAVVPAAGVIARIDPDVRDRSHPLDLLTIEFVTLLFESLLGDDGLPASVRSEIGRLQIVAIKAAMLDRSFFANRRHPMRRLLDRIAVIANDVQVDAAEGGTFHLGLRALVGRLVESFAMRLEAIVEAMKKFKSGERPSTIMGRLAKGYTDADFATMGDYFGKQKLHTATQPLDPAQVARGASLQEANCSRCHLEDGKEGKDDTPAMAGQWLPYLQMQMAMYLSGQRKMPEKMEEKVKPLSRADLDALLHFYASVK